MGLLGFFKKKILTEKAKIEEDQLGENDEDNVQLITEKYYKEFEEKPYVSEERDFEDWENRRAVFSSMLVKKEIMTRTKENILVGEVVLLWYVTNNKNTSSYIPQYFEYKYGINYQTVIEKLLNENFLVLTTIDDSLKFLTLPKLKEILRESKLKLSGKKNDLIKRITTSISREYYEKFIEIRGYVLTEDGKSILDKNKNIIDNHLEFISPTPQTFEERIQEENERIKRNVEDFGDIVEKYTISVYYDACTCEKCLEMENREFKYSEAIPGVNHPPFHEGCRCTSLDVLEFMEEIDNDSEDTKGARNKEGKHITIPSNMTYEEYKKKYLE